MDNNIEEICPYCSKTGTIVNPKFIEWRLNGCVDKAPKNVIVECPICNGRRLIPTRLGINILELVDTYVKEEN